MHCENAKRKGLLLTGLLAVHTDNKCYNNYKKICFVFMEHGVHESSASTKSLSD